MIHKEPLASYLKRRVFLGALGLSEGEPVVFSPLGQGEYNVNYSFIHPRTGKKRRSHRKDVLQKRPVRIRRIGHKKCRVQFPVHPGQIL